MDFFRSRQTARGLTRRKDMGATETVVVLGASPKRERYSNRAIRGLLTRGHRVIPVHPRLRQIEGLAAARNLGDIHEKVDTVTIYVSPARGTKLLDDILKLKPVRVVLNPGTESVDIEERLKARGIVVVKGCTLVMLEAGKF